MSGFFTPRIGLALGIGFGVLVGAAGFVVVVTRAADEDGTSVSSVSSTSALATIDPDPSELDTVPVTTSSSVPDPSSTPAVPTFVPELLLLEAGSTKDVALTADGGVVGLTDAGTLHFWGADGSAMSLWSDLENPVMSMSVSGDGSELVAVTATSTGPPRGMILRGEATELGFDDLALLDTFDQRWAGVVHSEDGGYVYLADSVGRLVEADLTAVPITATRVELQDPAPEPYLPTDLSRVGPDLLVTELTSGELVVINVEGAEGRATSCGAFSLGNVALVGDRLIGGDGMERDPNACAVPVEASEVGEASVALASDGMQITAWVTLDGRLHLTDLDHELDAGDVDHVVVREDRQVAVTAGASGVVRWTRSVDGAARG